MNVQPFPPVRKVVFPGAKFLAILIPASLMLSSCTNRDFKAAQQLGALSEGLRELNNSVSQDIYDSCVRSNNWLDRGTSQTQQNIRDGLKICDEIYRSNSDRARTVGDLLVGYVAAIGDLATGEQEEEVRTSFETIGEALGKLQLQSGDTTTQFSENTIATGVDIATFLTNLLLTDFRRRKIKIAVLCTDSDVQSYAADFANFIDELYLQAQLDDEIDSITRYYLQTNLLPEVTTQPLTRDTVAELQNTQDRRSTEQRAELLKVTERKNTASAYINLIRDTAATHATLKRIFNDEKDDLSPEQTAKCNQYFAQDGNQASLKTATSDLLDSEITQAEWEQVRQVMEAYMIRVKPLLQENESASDH